jgi:hypothetical protein
VGVLFSVNVCTGLLDRGSIYHCFRRGAALMVILRAWAKHAHTLNVDSFPLLHCLAWYDVI